MSGTPPDPSLAAYRQALDQLYELQKFGIKLGLNSTRNLLERLGDPHLAVPCVHLAGTNGKGSVGAMLEAGLLAQGLKVGMYTSPHLVRFSERFKINGREVEPARALELIQAVWQVADPREPPTFFEFVTAMAFVYFAQEKVDWLILETGLGGRLDATNVCVPAVSVITNVGLEHQEYLGDTYAQIAGEKAGIIKPGVPVAHGVAQPSARRVVEARAAELGAPIWRMGRELKCRRQKDGAFSLRGGRFAFPRLTTNLVGRHQPGNAALALGAWEGMVRAGAPLSGQAFAQGLTQVNWPGRLEKLPTGPDEPTLWLDGAHNPPAARVLAQNLDLVRQGRGPLVLVLGIMADKDLASMVPQLIALADRVVYSRPRYQRAADPGRLARFAPPGSPPGEVVGELGAALARAQELAGPQGVVLVSGSLFTVGEARALYLGEDTSDLP